jgi:hypothetical protein
MSNLLEEYLKRKDIADLKFYRDKLCSVNQFVGDGDLYIDTETCTFNSKYVEIVLEKKDGEIIMLICDEVISNGIKLGDIDEEFILFEELYFDDSGLPKYNINCCVFFENGRYIIKLDKNYADGGWWDYLPLEDPDDERFYNKRYKLLCKIEDYIANEGSLFQNIKNRREFVITRYIDDPSPVRILCSQELVFQLSNGKDPKDLLKHYIAIYVDETGHEYLRIFDSTSVESKRYHRRSAYLFIINQVMKNPYKYSFVDLSFEEINYKTIYES